MTLKEFTTPIRVYWDLPENREKGDTSHIFNDTVDGQRDEAENMGCVPIFSRICNELIDIKGLNLNLLDQGTSISEECLGILEGLKNAHMAISLTASASALDKQLPGRLAALNVRTFFAIAGSLDDLQSSLDIVNRHRSAGLSFGISFSVNRSNYTDLPEVFTRCLDSAMDYLVIPMQRLMEEGECFYITEKEREGLELKLRGIDKPERMKVIINDPFLWSAFFHQAQYPECGCQAANSMLYISRGFDVYPCPAMPLKLGDLRKTTLKEIISSAEKSELRRLINTTPEGCSDCKKLPQCLGGCRGRTYAVKGSVNGPDPACS